MPKDPTFANIFYLREKDEQVSKNERMNICQPDFRPIAVFFYKIPSKCKANANLLDHARCGFYLNFTKTFNIQS